MSRDLADVLAGASAWVRERNRGKLPAGDAATVPASPHAPAVPGVAVAGADGREGVAVGDADIIPRAVEFVVPHVQAWERHSGEGRAARTPPRTRAFQAMCRGAATLAMRGAAPLAGPVRLALTFYLRRPKGAPPGLWADAGPDFDNLTKGVADACNRVVYGDDRQVAEAVIRKIWTDLEPRTAVRVEPLIGEGW